MAAVLVASPYPPLRRVLLHLKQYVSVTFYILLRVLGFAGARPPVRGRSRVFDTFRIKARIKCSGHTGSDMGPSNTMYL